MNTPAFQRCEKLEDCRMFQVVQASPIGRGIGGVDAPPPVLYAERQEKESLIPRMLFLQTSQHVPSPAGIFISMKQKPMTIGQLLDLFG